MTASIQHLLDDSLREGLCNLVPMPSMQLGGFGKAANLRQAANMAQVAKAAHNFSLPLDDFWYQLVRLATTRGGMQPDARAISVMCTLNFRHASTKAIVSVVEQHAGKRLELGSISLTERMTSAIKLVGTSGRELQRC